MPTRRTFGLLLASGLTAAPAFSAERRLEGYQGSDAGQLVLSISARDLAQRFKLTLLYRRSGEDLMDRLEFDPSSDLPFLIKHDFGQSAARPNAAAGLFMGAVGLHVDHEEIGIVLVKSLPPGKYEMFNVEQLTDILAATWVYRFESDFSVGFEIRPNQATYIGEFKALPIEAKNMFGQSVPAGVQFALSDQGARDLPIANRNMRHLLT